MKKSSKTRKLVFYFAMAALMMLPVTSFAQGGFFGSAHGTVEKNEGAPMFQNRDAVSIPDAGMGTQGFGQLPAPLGSGVAMLIAAGAGYALLKSKKSNK